MGSSTDGLLVLILIAALTASALVLQRRWQSRRALVRRLAELSTLAEIGRTIANAELDLAILARLVHRQAGLLVDASSFQLGLFEGDRYRLLIWVVDQQPQPLAEFRLPAGDPGLIGWLRDTRQSLLIRDFQREAATLPAQARYESPEPPRSAVFMPLVVGDSALGAMAVQSRRPNAFDEEDVRLLSIVATYGAASLQNARLYEAERRRATQLALVAGVSQRINILQPLPSLYRQVVDLVAEKFGEYTVSYYERQGDALRLQVTSAVDASHFPASVELGEGAVGQAAITGQPALVWDLPEFQPDVVPVVGARASRADLAVPVRIDEQTLGVLAIRSSSSASLDESAGVVFQSLAAQVALAILEAQVYAAEQRRADHLAALAQASRTAASTLELDDLLDELLDVVNERFGYKLARVFLLHDDRLVLHAGTGGGTVGQTMTGLTYDLDGPGLIARVGRERELLIFADVAQQPDYQPEPGLEASRSQMAAPMVMGQRLMGVFDVQSERSGAFTGEDARNLQTLADTLALAVRNARLFEFERRRRRLAEIMREVSVALTSTLQLDSVLELILDGLALVVSYDAASILLVNDEGEMALRATRGAPGAGEAVGMPLAVRRYAAGEPLPAVLSFQEVDTLHEYHDLLALPEPHACLAAPLAPGGDHVGYLVVDCAGQTRFSRSETELIATFASQAAVAIENARLYTAQREQAWISTALLQVAEATARAVELDEVLDTVARLTPMLVGVDRCAVLLSAETGWRLAAYAGASDALTPEELAARFPAGLPVAGWERFETLLVQREPVVLDLDDEMPPGLRELFIGVVILLPLLAKGQVEGVMVVGQLPGETPFTTHRIRLLSGIANQAALAIESAMLTVLQQEEAWVSTALLQVAEAVAGHPLDEGLQTVARLTPILVGIEKVAIYQFDAERHAFWLKQVTGIERTAAERLMELPVTLGELGLAVAEREPARRVPLPVPRPAHLAEAFKSETCYAWPLRAGGITLGALIVEIVPVHDRRLAILNGIAHQVAMALENSRLTREVTAQQRLERELELARDIQASFLPNSYPAAPGWELSATWRAARQVGGDFYDFIPLRPGDDGPRWGIVVADVADKGVPAALFMALSRTLLRTVAISRVSPGETLGRVNDLILTDARSQQFVTVLYAVWEPQTGRVRYSVGGHNPPIWASRYGEVEVLPGRGMALGVLEHVQYAEQEILLSPGDSLLLFTDGLTDAVNASIEEFGLGRVRDVIGRHFAAPAQAQLDAVLAAVDAHVVGLETFDDMTAVVLRRAIDGAAGEER